MTSSARCRGLVCSIDIEAEVGLLNHHSDVAPFVHTEGASSIGTSIAYCIPTSGVGAISIGVAHEGAPTWTTLLVPVANRVRLDPELDGAIREAFLEDIGNGEAGLFEIYSHILFLASHRRDGRNHRSFVTSFVNRSYAVATSVSDGIREFLGSATKGAIDEHLIFFDFVAVSLRCRPSELVVAYISVGGCEELLTIYNGAVHRNCTLVNRYTVFALFLFEYEGSFYTFLVEFIVENADIVEVTRTLSVTSLARFGLGVDDEEVLQRT